MTHVFLSLIALSLCAVTLAACGEADTETAATTSAFAQAETPEEVGEAVKSLYLHAIEQTVALLEDRPTAEAVAPQLQSLQTQTIEQLVALGRKREQMDASDRVIVDRPMKLISMDADFMQAFQAFAQSEKDYHVQKDAPGYDVYQMIRGMNIITQYAFFELLREQKPEEAQRLGV